MFCVSMCLLPLELSREVERQSEKKKYTRPRWIRMFDLCLAKKKVSNLTRRKEKYSHFFSTFWCLSCLEHVFCVLIPFRWIIGFSSVWKLLFDAIFAHTHTVPSKPLIEQDTFTLNPKINCYFSISLSSIACAAHLFTFVVCNFISGVCIPFFKKWSSYKAWLFDWRSTAKRNPKYTHESKRFFQQKKKTQPI